LAFEAAFAKLLWSLAAAAADSPYRDPISMAILRLQEGGTLQMLYNKWWKNAGKCSGDDKQGDKNQNSLGLANVGGMFVILIGGLALAAVVAVIEFVWYNTRTNHRATCPNGQVGYILYMARAEWENILHTVKYKNFQTHSPGGTTCTCYCCCVQYTYTV